MKRRFISYDKQLKDPRWQKKRLHVFEKAGWKCTECGDAKSELHVHHKRYLRGKYAWEHPFKHLVALCAKCHTAKHPKKEEQLSEPAGERVIAASKFREIFERLGEI